VACRILPQISSGENRRLLGGSVLFSPLFSPPASGAAQPTAGTAGDPVTGSAAAAPFSAPAMSPAKTDEDEGQSVHSDPARPPSPPTAGSDVNEEFVGPPSPPHPLPGD
jgi:hypothetical protein